MSFDGLENVILRVIQRWWASARQHERHGIVTSYDPKTYLAKVAFQPQGQESGWLPIETGHIGSTYGIVVGLQPGQGGVNAQGQGGSVGPQSQNQGDQVIVRFQLGDDEAGKIVQRVHSESDPPPQAQSGEIIIYTKFQKSGGPTPDAAQGGQGGTGQQVYWKNDGSLSLTDGNGAAIMLDGNGNVKISCKNLQIDAKQTITAIAGQDLGIKANNNLEVKAGSVTGIDAGSAVTVQGKGDVADLQVTPPSGQPQIPPFTVIDP